MCTSGYQATVQEEEEAVEVEDDEDDEWGGKTGMVIPWEVAPLVITAVALQITG